MPSSWGPWKIQPLQISDFPDWGMGSQIQWPLWPSPPKFSVILWQESRVKQDWLKINKTKQNFPWLKMVRTLVRLNLFGLFCIHASWLFKSSLSQPCGELLQGLHLTSHLFLSIFCSFMFSALMFDLTWLGQTWGIERRGGPEGKRSPGVAAGSSCGWDYLQLSGSWRTKNYFYII